MSTNCVSCLVQVMRVTMFIFFSYSVKHQWARNYKGTLLPPNPSHLELKVDEINKQILFATKTP